MNDRKFGELEALITKHLLKKRSASVKELLSSLPKDLAYTTVLTVVTRLYDKGELTREKEGRSYIYSLKDEKKATKRTLADKVKKLLFKKRVVDAITYLVEEGEEISAEELNEIEALIEKKKRESHGN